MIPSTGVVKELLLFNWEIILSKMLIWRSVSAMERSITAIPSAVGVFCSMPSSSVKLIFQISLSPSVVESVAVLGEELLFSYCRSETILSYSDSSFSYASRSVSRRVSSRSASSGL